MSMDNMLTNYTPQTPSNVSASCTHVGEASCKPSIKADSMITGRERGVEGVPQAPTVGRVSQTECCCVHRHAADISWPKAMAQKSFDKSKTSKIGAAISYRPTKKVGKV